MLGIYPLAVGKNMGLLVCQAASKVKPQVDINFVGMRQRMITSFGRLTAGTIMEKISVQSKCNFTGI
jgi:hypothetical protein